jgi:hypothetical protein
MQCRKRGLTMTEFAGTSLAKLAMEILLLNTPDPDETYQPRKLLNVHCKSGDGISALVMRS